MLDLEGLLQTIYLAAVKGLEDSAETVAARARRLAPVRHLFAETRFHIRFKSASEMEADRGIRVRLGLSVEGSPDNPSPKIIYGRRPPVHFRSRRLAAADALLANYEADNDEGPLSLDKRGAYEVRSRRAQFTTFEHAHIGGRLRGEIHPTKAVVSGRRAEAWVISPTPYAKYMEFGTVHNAAHPYLRPAAEESLEAVAQTVGDAVRQASRTGAGTAQVEIVVRI